jgi:hypothetical protein
MVDRVDVRHAVGPPTVGPFGDVRTLLDLAAAEARTVAGPPA